MPSLELDHSTPELYSGNQLANLIERKICQKGPIPFKDYMQAWAYGLKEGKHFTSGYYSDNPQIGNKDFSLQDGKFHFETPPERTPLYGATMAAQIRKMWESMDYPKDFKIVEMGAGNGTMASDIMHGIQMHDIEGDGRSMLDSVEYIIVEQSSALARKQKERTKKFQDKVQIVRGAAQELPLQDVTGVFLSVELPDAFPVHPLRNDNGRKQELFIGKGNSANFEPVWQDASPEINNVVEKYQIEIPEDNCYPLNLDSAKWMQSIAKSLQKGFVITVDYQNNKQYPIRLYGGESVNPLDPELLFDKRLVGATDITAGIDFQLLKDVGMEEGLDTLGFMNQQGFLWANEFDRRMKIMAKKNGNYDGELAGRLYKRRVSESLFYDESNWFVLVQMKNIEGQLAFAQHYHPYENDTETGLRKNYYFKGLR